MAEEVEIMDATEKVADNQEEVRLACEEVAEEKSVAEMDDEADENRPQVAVPGMEVACGYNRYAQDLVPYDQKESIQIPREVDDDEEMKSETWKKTEVMGRGEMELIRIESSSLSELDKVKEMMRLFKEEVGELKEKSSKRKEEHEEKKIINLNKSEEEKVGKKERVEGKCYYSPALSEYEFYTPMCWNIYEEFQGTHRTHIRGEEVEVRGRRGKPGKRGKRH